MELPGPQPQLEAESLLKCCLRYLLVMLFNECESALLDTEWHMPRKQQSQLTRPTNERTAHVTALSSHRAPCCSWNEWGCSGWSVWGRFHRRQHRERRGNIGNMGFCWRPHQLSVKDSSTTNVFCGVRGMETMFLLQRDVSSQVRTAKVTQSCLRPKHMWPLSLPFVIF